MNERKYLKTKLVGSVICAIIQLSILIFTIWINKCGYSAMVVISVIGIFLGITLGKMITEIYALANLK